MRRVGFVCGGRAVGLGRPCARRPAHAHANVLGSRSAGDSHPSTAAPRTAGDVPVGSLSMSAGSASSNQTLFAQGQGQSFPLITMDGATYRMLQSPTGISSSLLGEELGQVTEFNVEPALGTSGMVSNVVARGETVYAISGMSGALVAAQVDGSTRAFQRVSYAGTAIIGSETLADTLCDPADVEWMELAGTGRISDVATAQQLMQILVDYADYQSTAMSGSGSLLIGLKTGSRCSCWSAMNPSAPAARGAARISSRLLMRPLRPDHGMHNDKTAAGAFLPRGGFVYSISLRKPSPSTSCASLMKRNASSSASRTMALSRPISCALRTHSSTGRSCPL